MVGNEGKSVTSGHLRSASCSACTASMGALVVKRRLPFVEAAVSLVQLFLRPLPCLLAIRKEFFGGGGQLRG